MRAVEVTIHNFRSICDATVTLQPCGMLVGANNAGKSSVIDAIRAFYGKGIKYEAGRDFPKRGAVDDESWVEIEFQPTEEELESLKDEYRSSTNTFRVRNYFATQSAGDDGKSKTGPYAYVNGRLSDERFYGYKNVGQGKFGDVIYIPAVSKIDEHTKLTGPSALRDLVNSVLTDVLESSDAYAALRASFSSFESSLKHEPTANGFSLQSIESDVSGELEQWGASFRLTINAVGVDEIVKGLVGHEIVDAELGTSQPVTAYGQGFQRSVIYTLIKVAAQYAPKAKRQARKEFSPELNWILFEEPEAFLHPNQIGLLERALRQLTSKDGNQVLMSTHSPQFVSLSMNNLPALCRLVRRQCCTKVFQVQGEQLDEILVDNCRDTAEWLQAGIAVDADDLTSDMEALKYALWLDSRRCEAFFAERVLLVEGPSETALVSYLRDLEALPVLAGVFAFDCMGKWNIHRFMRLFGYLGIEHYVIYDDDDGRHAPVAETIRATANEYTRGIDCFPGDVESFLGIARARRPHKKPQHILFQLSSGMVGAANVSALKAKIDMLFADAR